MSIFIIELVRSMSSCVSQTKANLSDSTELKPRQRSMKSSGAAMLPATAMIRLNLGSGLGVVETGIGSRGTASWKKAQLLGHFLRSELQGRPDGDSVSIILGHEALNHGDVSVNR